MKNETRSGKEKEKQRENIDCSSVRSGGCKEEEGQGSRLSEVRDFG
jgi:hypothetical protein